MSHDLIQVEPLTVIGKGDRGATFSGCIRNTTNFIMIQRYAGSLSGNTYHKGIVDKTNPKLFVLLSGEIIFRYRHIQSNQHQEIRLKEPCTIAVEPLVTHSVEALTDIIMLEANSLNDIEQDRTVEQVIKSKS